jgi:glutathione S-transferase
MSPFQSTLERIGESHYGSYEWGIWIEAAMITVYGEGRGFRVVWLLEEMGLPYRLRPVDLLTGADKDPEFIAINPGGFIPAMRDGNVTMVESIAIMEYLMARHGPTPFAPEPTDPAFPDYKQFLLLGEAGLATAIYYVFGALHIAPADQRQNWTAGQAMRGFESRLRLVTRQLARFPYMAGAIFTAADISVAYALMLARRGGCATLGEAETEYMARITRREAFRRALETCQATKEGYVEFR